MRKKASTGLTGNPRVRNMTLTKAWLALKIQASGRRSTLYAPKRWVFGLSAKITNHRHVLPKVISDGGPPCYKTQATLIFFFVLLIITAAAWHSQATPHHLLSPRFWTDLQHNDRTTPKRARWTKARPPSWHHPWTGICRCQGRTG